MFLITGGGGFIGSSIAAALVCAGERVRVLDDFSTGRRSNLAALVDKVELIEGSICDPEVVAKACQGVKVIFHQAAIPSVARSVAEPQVSLRVNVQGTTTVLDCARHAGVKRLIFAASSSAYGNTATLPKVETMPADPLSPYAVAKWSCERLLKVFSSLYGLETLSLRYFNVFGPNQDPASHYAAVFPNFMTAALNRERPKVFGDGEQTRDFCYIDNTVSANLLAASTGKKLSGEVANVACGERISLNTLLQHIGEEAGYVLQPEYLLGRAGDVRDSLADITVAHELLGYEPKVRVREGISRTFAAFKTLAARS
jgi:nucleoside-diphosphate-sugar epimerase